VISAPAGPRFGPYILTAVLGRGGTFARHTGFRPAACQWAVDELAAVLGLDSADARPVT
jgi:hypothetical protein